MKIQRLFSIISQSFINNVQKKSQSIKFPQKLYHYVELEKYPWTFKVHLRYKTIFCHRVALDV